MINISWLMVVFISTVSFCIGVIVYVLSERIGRKQKIIEAREEIIQAFCDYGYVEASRTENDYDLNIDGKGTEEIQKILEGFYE